MSAPTKVYELINGEITSYEITPEQYGFTRCSKEELVGGTPEENAEITGKILKGELHGAKRDIVLMNAGCGLYIAGKAASAAEGVKLAAELIDSGAAYKKLEEFIKESNA